MKKGKENIAAIWVYCLM